MRRMLSLLLAAGLFLSVLAACSETVPEESSVEEVSAPQPVQTIYPDWDAQEIYTAGDIVIHDGKYFKAL